MISQVVDKLSIGGPGLYSGTIKVWKFLCVCCVMSRGDEVLILRDIAKLSHDGMSLNFPGIGTPNQLPRERESRPPTPVVRLPRSPFAPLLIMCAQLAGEVSHNSSPVL